METIKFWYRFEDETKEMSNTDIDVTVENENGVNIQDVVEGFQKFLMSCGYSLKKAADYMQVE